MCIPDKLVPHIAVKRESGQLIVGAEGDAIRPGMAGDILRAKGKIQEILQTGCQVGCGANPGKETGLHVKYPGCTRIILARSIDAAHHCFPQEPTLGSASILKKRAYFWTLRKVSRAPLSPSQDFPSFR